MCRLWVTLPPVGFTIFPLDMEVLYFIIDIKWGGAKVGWMGSVGIIFSYLSKGPDVEG